MTVSGEAKEQAGGDKAKESQSYNSWLSTSYGVPYRKELLPTATIAQARNQL